VLGLALRLGQHLVDDAFAQVVELFVEVLDAQFAVAAGAVPVTGRRRNDAADHNQNRHHEGDDLGQKHAILVKKIDHLVRSPVQGPSWLQVIASPPRPAERCR
jgi:hypothetical protein